jgi:hypothetical protein
MGRAQFRRRLGHAIDGARGFVLRNRVMAGLAQEPQAIRAVAAHSGEQDADGFPRPVRDDARKKSVHGRTEGNIRGLTGVNEAGRAAEDEMIRRPGEQHGARVRMIAFAREAHVQLGVRREPVGEAGNKLEVHVLHHDDGRREIRGPLAQDFHQRRRTAGRRANRHETIAGGRSRPLD